MMFVVPVHVFGYVVVVVVVGDVVVAARHFPGKSEASTLRPKDCVHLGKRSMETACFVLDATGRISRAGHRKSLTKQECPTLIQDAEI